MRRGWAGRSGDLVGGGLFGELVLLGLGRVWGGLLVWFEGILWKFVLMRVTGVLWGWRRVQLEWTHSPAEAIAVA